MKEYHRRQFWQFTVELEREPARLAQIDEESMPPPGAGIAHVKDLNRPAEQLSNDEQPVSGG